MFVFGILYLLAAVGCILALKGLNAPSTAKRGTVFGIIGIGIVIFTSLISPSVHHYGLIFLAIFIGGAIGTFIALKIDLTKLPELMAAFHSLVGLSAVLIALGNIYRIVEFLEFTHMNVGVKQEDFIELIVGASIGAITFTGSVVAFLKLSGMFKFLTNVKIPCSRIVNLVILIAVIIFSVCFCFVPSMSLFLIVVALSFGLGYTLIVPIGGADMPVIVSMLNSYSGWAAAGIGFLISNPALIIVGSLVGSSGAILSYIMCKAMNRSIFNVIFGGSASGVLSVSSNSQENRAYKAGNGDDAAFILANASKVIIVPGYGMAVAQAQYVLKEMVDKLKENQVEVKYAIHPIAGRMPGHMNVLLAEANIPYDDVFELEQINSEFSTADVVYVIGANDVTNPLAKTDPNSPIYGMPVLDVEKAKTILFVKRSMGVGYSGIDNELFYKDNTMMLLGDAKGITESIVESLDNL